MLSAVKKSVLLTISITFIAACGTASKAKITKENQASNKTSDPQREQVVVQTNLNQETVGFNLTGASAYRMSLSGCASGLAYPDITEANPTIAVYKYDQGCLVKLESFTVNGIVYTPSSSDPFTSWAVEDQATFIDSSNTSSFIVRLASQLSSPIEGNNESVNYVFGDFKRENDAVIQTSTISGSATLSVAGDEALAATIGSVSMTGMTSQGAGKFNVSLQCKTQVTGTGSTLRCGSVVLLNAKYRLFPDTVGSVLTLNQAAALFDGSESSVQNTDLINSGSAEMPNGGFVAKITTPNQMHLNPNMLLVIKTGISYVYFNLDLDTI